MYTENSDVHGSSHPLGEYHLCSGSMYSTDVIDIGGDRGNFVFCTGDGIAPK